MHTLKPDTKYKLVEITLACPESIEDAEIADWINESLNEQIRYSDCVFDDWKISFTVQLRKTNLTPQEGDLFSVWNEHPDYPRYDWRAVVSAGDTLRGYWDWVNACIERDLED